MFVIFLTKIAEADQNTTNSQCAGNQKAAAIQQTDNDGDGKIFLKFSVPMAI